MMTERADDSLDAIIVYRDVVCSYIYACVSLVLVVVVVVVADAL
jgi:hypothetical protein